MRHNERILNDMDWFFGQPTERDMMEAEIEGLLTPRPILAPDSPDYDASRYDNMPNYSPIEPQNTPHEQVIQVQAEVHAPPKKKFKLSLRKMIEAPVKGDEEEVVSWNSDIL